ncbi:MAG TPA: DUF1611 domain-containing protein [Thermoguttaceae bacterium]|nr:DUF1611 domain-containing protein [Thermoguttaceae bacterium]
MPRRMIILTDGYTHPGSAKTAVCVIRYRLDEVAAVFDRQWAGRSAQDVLGVGPDVPVVDSLDAVADANTLLLGTAPAGGKLPPHWRPIILDAIARGMDIVSGLHDFLRDDREFVEAARRRGVRLIDLRANDEHDVATREGIRPDCLRIHTMANAPSIGKMVAGVEVVEGLRRRGVDAKFVATGQTGILVEGDGCPVDRVISDFVAGAAEKLVRANQHHEVIVVEGQGALSDFRYSGVTLSLLHGCQPDGIILVCQLGREFLDDGGRFPIVPIERLRPFIEEAANLVHPCRSIGVAVNGRGFPDDQVAAECERLEASLGLPTCDVLRHGPEKLVQAVLNLQQEKRNHR